MRCFIAIELPEEVKSELREIQDELREVDGMKASFNKDYHITLRFLGEITEAQAQKAMKALAKCRVEKLAPMVSKLGLFPGNGPAKLIWAGIEPEEGIARLKERIDEALEGIFPKEKGFKAHVTIARVKHSPPRAELIKALGEVRLEKARFTIEGFKLIESVLGKDGATYREIGSYP